MRIGMLLTPDNAIDPELWRWCPPEVSLHITRTPHVEMHGLDDMEASILVSEPGAVEPAVRSLPPIDPAVIVFGCTSGSFVRGLKGESAMRRTMREAGGRQAITTFGAMLAAFAALELHRIAIVTPYDDRFTGRLVGLCREAGHEVTGVASMRPTDLNAMAAEDVVSLAEQAMATDADGLFISCTALETIELLAPLQKRYGVPVLSAVQVTMCAALAAAGASFPVGRGELFDRRLAPGVTRA